MAQAACLSPRPGPYALQDRKTGSARRSQARVSRYSPATPATARKSSTRTPSYAAATATSSSRKRARRPEQTSRSDSSTWMTETPSSEFGSSWAVPSLENSAMRSDFASPEPFVNTRYNLAGGLDTPGQARECYFDQQFQNTYGMRRRRDQHQSSHVADDPTQAGAQRLSSAQNASPVHQTWGQFVFSVAGKVWTFGTTAFKGFYAGGGQGYGVDASADVKLNSDDSIWESMHTSAPQFERESTPVPGSFPQDDDDDGAYGQRPAKKVHMESGESPWVVVSNPMDETSPRRKAIHQPPPPASRIPAVINRRSLIPVSRRTSGYQSPSLTPGLQQPHRSPSYAHRRSSSDVTPVAKPSPLSPEAHKYIVERQREEKRQDASIKRMNDQLRALLKEGRAALGTKFEVTDDDNVNMEDEGYFDDGR